ncbi:MAG: hypothetical protein K6G37_02680 [Bacilli bacterium]|nr:hypothetical protein [Bacilli bacterium]
MLKPENVTAFDLFGCMFDFYGTDPGYSYIISHGLYTVKDVLEAVKNNPDINWRRVLIALKYTLDNIEKFNEKDKPFEVYPVKEYTDINYGKVDKKHTVSELLLVSPTIDSSVRYSSIKGMSITELKKYLNLVKSNGFNYLTSSTYYLGEQGARKLQKAVDFFTEQVERQALVAPKTSPDFFNYAKKEKLELVSEYYSEIVNYLVDNARELICDDLTDSRKKILLSSIENSKREDREVRLRMSQYVANYTTLPELDALSKGNTRCLKRFIVTEKR